MKNILVATIHMWNEQQYSTWKTPKGYKKFLINNKDQLTLRRVQRINPEFIFFPHWSWKIPENIFSNFKCVVFHMTDLPFGRGGTPLQNLLLRGIYNAKISAVSVDSTIDGGPIYLKKKFMIKEGSAEDIYKKASVIIFQMIDEIINKALSPKAQRGGISMFNRRKPHQSELATGLNPRQIYDFIRMLDAPGYPHAFLKIRGYKLELKNARLDDSEVYATARITKFKK